MKGDLRCIQGRQYRHDPQPDDPGLETDIGQCPECEGDGCRQCDCCGTMGPTVIPCWAGALETFACDDCRDMEP